MEQRTIAVHRMTLGPRQVISALLALLLTL